ncbi:hypothetical protein BGX27_000190 [Mortierella sp. AM989]|nr:hypothetical protein BGX27_000190 [Mortierella sp. AM989]
MNVENDIDAEGFVHTSIVKEEDEEGTDESVYGNSSIKFALQKLRRGIVKIGRSSPRLENFMELTTTPNREQSLSPLLDTTFLRNWDGALKELLEHFDKLTTKICVSKTYVTITMAVIVYNNHMEVIEKFIDQNKDRLPDIYQGAKAAYDKLGQYYAATDNSPIYSVVTAIHPAMCFQYWSDQRWEARYEKDAKQTARNMWKVQYAANTSDDLTQPRLDASDDDIELALPGLTKKPKGADGGVVQSDSSNCG